jgi:dipicolinate synthase subunit B
MNDTPVRVGYALCGSFCTFNKAITQIENLKSYGADVYPIMSHISYNTDTRFGKADEIRLKISSICEHDIIHTIEQAEPVGPKKMFDILIIAPCTGNTLAKLALSITDTPVTMAVKSHLRNNKPVLIGVCTNDALGGSMENIGKLMNLKNFYFITMGQDDPDKKPKSIVTYFDMLIPAMEKALDGIQIQPILK